MGNDFIIKNELFDALANSSDRAYLYITDLKTRKVRWSKSAVEYFDLPSEEFDNYTGEWESGINPEDYDLVNNEVLNVLNGKKNTFHLQYRRINKYNKYVWLEGRGSVINDENGNPHIFAGIITSLDNSNKYDSLTSLYTINELYNKDLSGKEGYLLLIGIDEFRKILSSYGYIFGDHVLVEFAKKLLLEKKEEDTVFRFCGDEFLILYNNIDKEDIMHLFDNITRIAANLGTIDERAVGFSVSGGAVRFSKPDYKIEDYIDDLENCLDMAKANRKGSLVFYSDEVRVRRDRIRILKEDLKNSINNNFKGFELYFQPLVAVESGKVAGCEALLRWHGDVVKDSYPSEFVKILEEDGSIKEVGLWVMQTAVRQLKEWENKYGDIKLSFNISYQQFLDERFIESLFASVDESKINTSNLIAELTESCKIENPEALQTMFTRLKDRGIQVALDDFGTAYSSMELLKILPATHIKIEHSFVRELSEKGHDIDYAIIESILSLCDKLNCSSVVEGVENEAVKEIVENMNPTYMQGYYFSRPICKEEFEGLLEKQIR